MPEFDTKVVRGTITPDPSTGAITPPLFQTATYVLDQVGVDKGFDYTRGANPTVRTLEETLAEIEGAKYGVCYASGMAAVDTVLRMLKSGDHVVSTEDVYGGVSRLFNTILSKFGIEVTYVDTADEAAVEHAIRPNTKMLWIETPTNPLLHVTDIAAVSAIAKAHNLTVAVDSTFATPALLQPLSLGADIVIHSTTKYLSGHNQLVGGAVLTNDEKIFKELRYLQKSVGAVPSPFDCWLTLLGLKTLSLRMERHCRNAGEIAAFLEAHPLIEQVRYPGLLSHPQHQIAKAQQSGFGGMITFEVVGGVEAGKTLLNSLKLCSLAESLGAVESMITHPASMTHVDVPRDERIARGLLDGTVRLSVGIEDVRDITADLTTGLAAVQKLVNSSTSPQGLSSRAANA